MEGQLASLSQELNQALSFGFAEPTHDFQVGTLGENHVLKIYMDIIHPLLLGNIIYTLCCNISSTEDGVIRMLSMKNLHDSQR